MTSSGSPGRGVDRHRDRRAPLTKHHQRHQRGQRCSRSRDDPLLSDRSWAVINYRPDIDASSPTGPARTPGRRAS